ncbi:MAG: pitrilysin family protein [Bryobacteraceae bacterium]|nr:pitrilysin family protein [Bryobacteraceae bacterium]
MRTALALTACLLLGVTWAQPAEPASFNLENGMKVIVEEDHDIPNVAMYFFYKVGSRNERPGITGISHFFEHMMFNGAKKFGPKAFDNEMEKAGGRNNAYTSRDMTVYQDWFPSTALRLMFEMEADRIRDLSFDPKIIESERGVVASERQTRTDNSNFGLLYEQLNAAAYTAHSYGWPVVGWASDIQAWSLDDLKAHFRMGYAPNNCTMVVVGDVTLDAVRKLAKEFIEPIPSQQPPAPVRTVEPAQRGERRVTIVKAAQVPQVMLSYHIGTAADADDVALDVLSTVLTNGRSSRLYSRLVDKEQLALNIGANAQPGIDPGQFLFFLSPRAGVDPAVAEKALLEEIEKLRTTDISADELRKAKNLQLTQLFQQRTTISGRANLLGQYEIYKGDFRKLYKAQDEIEGVSAADVRRAAQKYFDSKNRTVATLIPEKAPVIKETASK